MGCFSFLVRYPLCVSFHVRLQEALASEVRVRNSCVCSEVGGRVYAPPLQHGGYALILCIFWCVSMASDDITATTYHKHPYLQALEGVLVSCVYTYALTFTHRQAICTHIRVCECRWACATGGCTRSVYTEIHRLGFFIVNHKNKCYIYCVNYTLVNIFLVALHINA